MFARHMLAPDPQTNGRQRRTLEMQEYEQVKNDREWLALVKARHDAHERLRTFFTKLHGIGDKTKEHLHKIRLGKVTVLN